MDNAKRVSLSFFKKKFLACRTYLASVPLVWRITVWHALFLILMFLLMSGLTLQLLSTWEEYEIRSELSREVTHISQFPQSYHSFSNDLYAILYSSHGDIVRGFLPSDFNKAAPFSLLTVESVQGNDFKYYYMDAPFRTPTFTGWVRGIVPATVAHRHMQSMIAALAIGGFSFILLAALGGYVLIYSGLKPIRTITKTARDIGHSEDFSKRIEKAPSSDEISQLTTTFNYMLDRLEQSLLREKQFTSDVSHELRTPISVIQAESDYGRNYIQSVEEAKESFQNIFNNCKNISSLITQLLELTRLGSYENIPMEPVNISDLLREIINEYEVLWLDKNLQISFEIDDNLVIDGNYILLRRAISNLLSNATKFTKSKIDIVLEKSANNHIKIAITDNGMGIAKENIPKLWNRFYQVDSSRNRNKGGGVGLGLYFVYMVTVFHKGHVAVNSEPNVATTFEIIL